MPLNPSIALGVRPLEIPNQLAQYAQVAQIEGAQRQNEVARMQLEQLQQDRTEMQAFQKQLADNGGNPDLKQFAAMLLKSPKYYEKGVEMVQKLQEQDKFDAYLKRMQPAAAPAAPGMLGSGTAGVMPAGPAPAVNALAPTPGGMLAAAPVPVNALAAQPTLADLEARLREVSRFNIPQAKAEAEMIKDQIKIMRTPSIVGAGSTVFANGAPVYTAPEKAPAPPSMVAEYTFAKTPDGGNFRGSYQDFVTARAAASRALAPPAAPTITQIVDPTNPNQMITIDARRYQGGGASSPGVIGVSGKEPSAALRENKTEAGKTQLADDLENLRFSFQKLDSLRAIPSTERNALSNVTSGLASTAIGQRTGQLFATEAQVERDVINSARSRLVNSIKNATGMSAQQLNSNVELQTMLKSISDPGQSYQSAIRIIEDIEDAYVKGKGMKNRGAPAPAPAATQGTGGFKYLGKESTK